MSAPPSRGPIVVDTGVFGAELVRRGAPIANAYRPLLEGRPVIISWITAAEIRYGAALAGWGASRVQRLESRLERARIVWPGPELTDTYVELRVKATRAGHGIAHKHHEADRWIAATALWLGIPLAAHDGIFRNIAGLTLEHRSVP